MCKDVNIVAEVLKKRSCLTNVVFGDLEQIVINRILLELYCQNYDSEHFRNCPKKENVRLHIMDTISFQVEISNDFNKYILNMFQHPNYYKKVGYPISLNTIKTRLEAKTPSYLFVNDILGDMMLVFSNAMMYYSVSAIEQCAILVYFSLMFYLLGKLFCF